MSYPDKAEVMRLAHECATVPFPNSALATLGAKLDQLYAALAEAQKDAERYRWLRSKGTQVFDCDYGWKLPMWGPDTPYPNVMDALESAIDAAIAASRGEG